jgi:hypothetical protein
MGKRQVIFGAACYVDADGLDAVAFQGETVDFSAEDEKRLDELGALFDAKKAAEQEKATEAARLDAVAANELAVQTEKERVAGEKAAARKSG